MPAYRAVLFDFFGTLTYAIHRGATHAHIANWLGCEPTAFAAALDRSFMDRATGAYGSPAEALRRVAGAAGSRPNANRVRAALAARYAAVRADTRLRDEAVPVLVTLRRRGLRTAIVSDCTEDLPRLLPSLPIAHLIDAAVFSIDERVCKPHPDIYLSACRRLGVEPPECVYIGDGGSHELSGATALGMTAVLLRAPDLTGHLRFNGEPAWHGRTATSLTEAIGILAVVTAGRER
jgi:putative hydrolase of the HAD superfamily